jgi:DNA-binding MarR family transcriptional regulator
MTETSDHQRMVQKASESLWKTIPPFWHYMRSLIHRIAREDYGITPTQFQVLRRIRQENKRTVSDLSNCMFVSRPCISRAVDELVGAGMVERKGDSTDRRVIYLTPSAKGAAIVDDVHVKNSAIMREIFLLWMIRTSRT